jgi:hypothetical protein
MRHDDTTVGKEWTRENNQDKMLCLSLTRTLFMTVVLLPLTLFAAPDKALLDLMKSKSLIGTFGFPSSGNVWMQEMLRFTPGISTTLDACVAKNGANAAKACTATSVREGLL